MEQFRESATEKMLLAKLLLRIQETYEEREELLRRYLSQEDIDRLLSEHDVVQDPATVRAKYLHAVCGHSLRSFNCHVSRLMVPLSPRLI